MNAQARGAVGTLIYSDPQLDGSTRGPAYPDGGWRPSSSVQRGSAVFNSLCAGDPSRAASPLSVEEVCGFSKDELVPAIPVMPISVSGVGRWARVGCLETGGMGVVGKGAGGGREGAAGGRETARLVIGGGLWSVRVRDVYRSL